MEFDLNDGVAVLRRTPATLTALLDGLPAGWTEGTDGPDTWSPHVVIGHLNRRGSTAMRLPVAGVPLRDARAFSTSV